MGTKVAKIIDHFIFSSNLKKVSYLTVRFKKQVRNPDFLFFTQHTLLTIRVFPQRVQPVQSLASVGQLLNQIMESLKLIFPLGDFQLLTKLSY